MRSQEVQGLFFWQSGDVDQKGAGIRSIYNRVRIYRPILGLLFNLLILPEQYR